MNYHRFFIVQIFFLVRLTETSLSFQRLQSPHEREMLFCTTEIIPSVKTQPVNEGENFFLSQSFQKVAADSNTLTECFLTPFRESTLNYYEIQKKTDLSIILKSEMQKIPYITTVVVKTLLFPSTTISSLLCNKYTSLETFYYQNHKAIDSNKQAVNSVLNSTLSASWLNP
ncbi:hypothetical protein H0X06_01080 [Candidatus Dependentiae bacterium]|nr:hypothetical protein [Candidatus Dependentiae bacterium]